jgi:hypothetical protein
MSLPSLVQSCLWTVTRCVPLVQQKLLTLIRAHEFTQPCSILSLNSDTMGAPSAAETSYLTFIRAHEFTQLWSILSLNNDTMGAPSAAETSYLTFISAHEFTQPCSILFLNSDTVGAPSAAETSYLYHSTWVHPALFSLVFEQWHDGCP